MFCVVERQACRAFLALTVMLNARHVITVETPVHSHKAERGQNFTEAAFLDLPAFVEGPKMTLLHELNLIPDKGMYK